MKGVIFDVKRFAVHDGAGIRSTLFLKGCPLNCRWCQNPEGLSGAAELWYIKSKCLFCRTCTEVCPADALTWREQPVINAARCDCCGKCVSACPGGALEIAGREIEAEEAAKLLLRDAAFFGRDGGVTLSGGEALLQAEFACEVLSLCRRAGANTAVESCLMVPRSVIDAALAVTDHFIIDIKLLNAAAHKAATGQDNALILSNYEYLVSRRADILVRTPLIPGYTASEENIRAIARYIHKTDPDARWELLNFNPLCRGKYAALGREYPVSGAALGKAELDRFYTILEQEHIKHIIKE